MIIVALGESIVVVGAGAVGVPLDLRLVIVAWLSLALSAALWWLYFRDEDGVERAMKDASPTRRARVALTAFGYWHYGLVLGVVAVAAGLKKAVGDPYDPLDGWIGSELAVGVALFTACTVGFRTTLGLGVSRARLVAAAAALATIPVGTEWTAAGELAALTLIVAAALVIEGSRRRWTLRVYGCAAEETEGAKVYMARDGLFDDVDACLHWHPWSFAAVMNMRLAAANSIRIAFHGKTAHAGMEPWSGRSALDGLELVAHGLNLMREHVEPTARIHYIYEAGGRKAPNVVPV